MEVNEVKHHIQSKQFNSLYIFTGQEWAVQRVYIDMIAKASEKSLKYIDSITDVYSKLTNKSFIQQSYVYVVRDDKELMTNEKLQSQLDKILNNDILILLVTSVDKRTKFYKAYKDTFCEFEALKSSILKKYIQKEINLSDKNCEKLMEACEYDYGRCLLEIDKIKQYADGCVREYGKPCNIEWNEVFHALLEDGTIYIPPKDAIFDFVDAILDDSLKCFDLYRQCLEVGEAVMVMLSVLYNNAKAVLQVQSCESKDVSKATGLNGWQIKNATKHTGVYRNGELINIMSLCQKCQKGIVTGTMSEEFAMPYIMTNVL